MASKFLPNPLSGLRVSSHQIPAHGLFPNTSVQQKPLMIYHSAFSSSSTTTPSSIEAHVESIRAVVPQWRYTMYSFSHYHSTSHEVLCIASGAAKCCFGGETNPSRIEPELRKGDVVVVPAGVSHRLLKETESPFQMVGCYPPGKQWDMCYGKEGEESQVQSIKAQNWFHKDPIYGEEGPALRV